MVHRRIPSLNWLRVFEAAARTESFSDAAHILNMSPSAVSQQISALEHHLGEPLFERHARRVKLSEAGALFLPTVHDSLAAVETRAGELFGAGATEQLTIQVATIFAMSWLAPRLAAFQDAHPGIALRIDCMDHFDGRSAGRADVVISIGPSGWTEGETVPLFPETVYPVAAPDVARAVGSPDDLMRHRLIEVTGHRQTWRLVLARLGVETEDEPGTTAVSTTNLAFSLAASGFGIALARSPATDWLAERFGLERLLDDFAIGGEGAYILATKPANRRRRVASVFRDWIVAECAAMTD